MTLRAIPSGASVFLDANIFIYHFSPHPVLGGDCNDLMRRIESGDIAGFTSTHIVGEAEHRLMLLEASLVFGWPSKIVERLKRQPAALRQLTHFRKAVNDVLQSRVQVLAVQPQWLDRSAEISQQFGLLSNDALAAAVMEHHGLSQLASHDGDFDRVPGLTRYAPA